MPTPYELGKMAKITLAAIAVYLVNYLLEHYEQNHFLHIRAAAQLAYPWMYVLVVVVAKAPLVWLYAALIHFLRVLEPEDKTRIWEFINGLRGKMTGNGGMV